MESATSREQTYLQWLGQEIARHEQRRIELRAAMRFELSAESECHRTAFEEARAALLRLITDGEG